MIAWILLIASFALGNIYRFSFFSPDIKISILDCTVFILTIVGLRVKRIENRIIMPILVFFSLGLLSLIPAIYKFGIPAVTVGAMYLLRWLVYSLFFTSIIYLIKLDKINKLLLCLGILTAILGLGQYFLFPDVRSLSSLEWDPHYYRVVGSWLDPGFTGIILVFTLILTTLRNHKFLWFLTYIPFALTYSRSSYAAFLVSMAYIAWKQKGWKFFVKILLLFTITIYLLPRTSGGEGVKLERTSSISSRIESWKTAGNTFLKNPILGVGFNVYRYVQGTDFKNHAGAGSDSSLLFVAATTGILGLSAYLWYLKRLLSLEPITYYLIPLLVHSLFLNSLFYPPVMVWLSLLVLCASGFPPDPMQRIPVHSLQNLNSKQR